MPETQNEDLNTLKRSHVFMKDPDNVRRMISKIRKDGADKLQIVSDFDLTLTKQHVNGKPILSSFGIFYESKQIPAEEKALSDSMCLHYRPIEMDPHLDVKTKIEAMENWMSETQKSLRNIQFDTSELDDLVKLHGTDLRDGTKELFEKLETADVPVLVFSAGLGDVVEHVLKHNSVLLKNVKVISNFLEFNEGKINGFKNELLIHVFNKNEHAVDKEYFKILEGRSNVILMGDMDGDATMADGVENAEAILKIGFLYNNVEQRLASHMEAFDIVLVDDQTMDVVNEILNEMK